MASSPKEPVEPKAVYDSRYPSAKTSLDLSRAPSKFDLSRSPSKDRNVKSENDNVAFDDEPNRPPLEAMRSLSMVSERHVYPDDEPNWPREWRAYACLLGGFLLMFNSWGIVNAYGTYASYYMQHLLPGEDILLFNLVGSTQSFTVLLLSAVVGRFLDAGYHRTLIVTGSVLVTLGSFLLSVSVGDGGYAQGNYGLIWLTQGLVTGLGMACFFVTSSQVVATWFRKKKGFAIGMVASGASIAGLIYPLMIKTLIQEVGFNNAQRYTACLTAVTCLLAIVIARPNPAHISRKPETWARISVWIDTHAFRNHSFAWLCAAISFLFFGFYAVFFNLEEWAAETGIGFKDAPDGGRVIDEDTHPDAMRAFWLLSIMNATSTIGRLSSAYLCDHFGAMNVHCFVTFVASLLTLLLWTLADTVKSALAFVIVFGIFSGAVIGLPPASVAHILGPDPTAQAKLGQWTGMMYSCSAVFALTGPVIAGHLITEFANDFRTVQLWSGACMFLSACCMAMSIYSKHRAMTNEWFSDKRRRLSSVTSVNLSKSRSRGGVSQREEEARTRLGGCISSERKESSFPSPYDEYENVSGGW